MQVKEDGREVENELKLVKGEVVNVMLKVQQ